MGPMRYRPLPAPFLAALAVLAALALPLPSRAFQDPGRPQPQPGETALRDQVLAVVDEDPILASDLDRAITLGFYQQRAGEADLEFRKRVLDALIEERLRFHEIDRFGFEQVPMQAIDEQVAEIRGRFATEPAFREALREVGLDPKGLRMLVARQLLVLNYVDERLGARVFVTREEIQEYYQNVLVPEMRRQGQEAPPLDDVREDVRNVLREQKTNQEIETWTEELRREADITIHAEPSVDRPLPPVVKRIDKPREKKPGGGPPGG
jgi:hypothetical protein